MARAVSSEGTASIYLLADSQLLFSQVLEPSVLQRVVRSVAGPSQFIQAAYLGASNGDRPEFYEMFVAAMAQIGVLDCLHIRAQPGPAELLFLRQAQIVLLAGGDVGRGWQAFENSSIVAELYCCAKRGAVLMGVSAGAVQLGLVSTALERPRNELLGLVPYVLSAHQQPNWEELSTTVAELGSCVVGIGIPAGGGAVLHSDGSLEPIGKALCEIRFQNGIVRTALSEVRCPSGSRVPTYTHARRVAWDPPQSR